jgi:hypothetical protein
VSRRALLSQPLTSLFGAPVIGVVAALSVALSASDSAAYQYYSVNYDEFDFCAHCHGAFALADVSLSEGATWPDTLHFVHRRDMLDGDCETCHQRAGGIWPRVDVGYSDSGTGLAPIACAGCHGRAEDGTGAGSEGYSAGLRRRHWVANRTINGRSTRICATCHTDADPADGYTPVDESYLPPYYADPGTNHPNIPSDPCNPQPGYPEDFAGSTRGLDNDGNGLYDEADTTACAAATPTPTATPTATPTSTPTATPTVPPPTATPTSTPTATPTATFTPTATSTAASTPTATSTATSTPTATSTATSTPTATSTATSTPTATLTPTPTPEPGLLLQLASGVLALVVLDKRRRSANA